MRAKFLLAACLIFPLIANAQNAFERYGLSYDARGKLIDGRYIQKIEDQQIVKVLHFKKGILQGDFAIYTMSGSLIEKGNYLDGQKHGKWMTWSEDGIKTSEVSFNYGQRDGKWQIWDADGALQHIFFYQVGEKVGVWQSYDENGQLKDEKDFTRTV